MKSKEKDLSNPTRGHPPCGGCGLKWLHLLFCMLQMLSPSVWRVWIEILFRLVPSTPRTGSPSVWRVWIEIAQLGNASGRTTRHPPCGGCGLKSLSISISRSLRTGHPPCGGCGLKSQALSKTFFERVSPSVWRVWIEILAGLQSVASAPVTLRVEGVD